MYKPYTETHPIAMISAAFCKANSWTSSRVSFGLWKNFSSSVNLRTLVSEARDSLDVPPD